MIKTTPTTPFSWTCPYGADRALPRCLDHIFGVLQPRCSDLLPLRRAADPWGVVVRASPEFQEGSVEDLKALLRGKTERLPTKQGEFNGTILVHDKASRQAGRCYLPTLLKTLRRSGHDEPMFSISFAT